MWLITSCTVSGTVAYVGPSGPAPRCRHANGFAAGHTASTLPFAIYVSVSALRRDAVLPTVCSDARRSGPLPAAATAVTGVPVSGDPDILVADPTAINIPRGRNDRTEVFVNMLPSATDVGCLGYCPSSMTCCRFAELPESTTWWNLPQT